MTTDLIIIRHGESEANVGLSKEADCSLTEKGREQAREVAHRLSAHDLSGYVGLTSPYCRAKKTAEEIANLTGLSFTVDENIREWAGAATVNGKHYPAESGEELTERLRAFLRQHEHRKLVVVSHAAPIAVLMQLAWGETPNTEGEFWAGVPNGCLRWLRGMRGGGR